MIKYLSEGVLPRPAEWQWHNASGGGTVMRHNNGRLQGTGKLDLHHQSWQPSGEPRGVVVALHGLGDHSGIIGRHLKEPLTAKGYALYGLDLRGHGLSGGIKGHAQRWSEYLNDLGLFLEQVRREQPAAPLYVLGHSLGGLLALDYTLHHPEGIEGLIAICPVVTFKISRLERFGAYLLSMLRPTQVLIDKPNFHMYKDDPLAERFILTARLATEIDKAQTRVKTRAGDFRTPMLLLMGLEDATVPPAEVRRFFDRVTAAKQWREYPETGHNPLDEGRTADALGDLLAWLP